MKSLITLWQMVASDFEAAGCRASTARDLKTIASRTEDEGLSFLTITLANFGKDFQKSLELGFVDHDHFMGFSRSGGLPRFLGGFLDRVFDRSSGRLLDTPNVESIRAIHQLTSMFAKIEIPCAEHRVKAAFDAYVQCEQDVREADLRRTESERVQFRRISSLLWSRVLWNLSKRMDDGNLMPRHGPGATADKLRGNAKWNQTEWTQRLDAVFPVGDYLLPSHRHWNALESVDILEPGAERPVRVITVPKTLKTPRIIAIEPTCMQYVQQAISGALVELLENLNHSPGFLGFTDQEPNRLMAMYGSTDRSLTTIDLSEASDRVSNQHVRDLLDQYPNVLEGVEACRSRKADVPGHGVIRLAKFASMGSALTFPIEAMVFATIVFCGVEDALDRPLTPKDLHGLRRKVRIYGDDIIVPTEYAQSVIQKLEDFGLRVNKHKTFMDGHFRESCGGDYFAGEWITPIRVRRLLPRSRHDVRELISAVSLRNQLYGAGLWNAARWLDTRIEKLIPFPRVLETSPVLGRVSFLGFETQRVHPDYHSPLVKGMVVKAKTPVSKLDDLGALLKFFLKQSDLPIAEGHLERQGRPVAVDIKHRWAAPH